MTQPNRLKSGGRIERENPVYFTFNGKRYQGYRGDTLASALLANGVKLIGRSFKYHRPRGIVASGVEEPNAIVQLETGARTLPDYQATAIELYDGLYAESVNCWPSPNFDVMAINNLIQRFIPAGFYYKTFMWPKWGWKYIEPFIRQSAGLGKVPSEPDPDIYDKKNTHCDVLVVGAGPAGLSAALAAGRSGARVILCDDQPEAGGWLLNENHVIDDAPALDWVAMAMAELLKMENVRVLNRTTAFGYYDHNFAGLLERRGSNASRGEINRSRQRLWRVRAKQVVLATGAIERPMIFSDNDRPGVMLAGAVRAYVNRYGTAPGNKVCIFTNNDSAYRTALELHDAGVSVQTIIDVRDGPDGDLPLAAMSRGIEVIDNSAITGVTGNKGVKSIEVMSLNADASGVTGDARQIDCDLVGSSSGWNPALHLHSHSGGKAVFEDERAIFVPGPTLQNNQCCGAANGQFSLAEALESGNDAGTKAATMAGFKKPRKKVTLAACEDESEGVMRHVWAVPTTKPIGQRGKHFLDPQNDVTAADVQLAAREGYRSIEHAKRYTTLGMASDQGKTGNIPGMAVLAHALGVERIGDVGTTTFRPPYTPVTMGALAGRDVGAFSDPARQTPIHHWHQIAGCKWEDVGQWKRPWYYPTNKETMRDAVMRECHAARNAIGILDATTLGKISIQGPDAAEFLNRIYTNAWSKLAVGKCRYGLMLKEDGMIMDDGVTSRLGENDYLMTTTTGNAAAVLAWMEEWQQTEWPELKVYFTSVTEQWATVSICGPKARHLLSELTTDISLSPSDFPFMTVREGTVAGLPARVFRISFTGESSYEINVPASTGMSLWTALINAGQKYGITPFGTETMHVLRAEKGYIIVGQETDGTTTPYDLGMNWIVSKTKDFIGKRSLARADNHRPDRKQLVGLLPLNPMEVLPEGGQITVEREPEIPAKMIGHVTSSYYSSTLERSFALALIKGGRERHGDIIHIALSDKTISAKITDPVFYDPKGERLNG